MSHGHIPVLYDEVLALLRPYSGGSYIDATLGAGGHSEGILEATQPDGRLLGFDRDPDAVSAASKRLEGYRERATFVVDDFALMATVAPRHGFEVVDGIVMDLGLSSRQLDNGRRGFSFLREGPLDMRFNPEQAITAADLVNELPEDELADIFWRYGEERHSRRIARTLVARRPFASTTQLASAIEAVKPRQRRKHAATQVFQALRIAVNQELASLEQGLGAAVALLRPGGRVAVISFHSLEDRIVKQTFRYLSKQCVCPPEQPICTCHGYATVKLVTRKAIQASELELRTNPRSRSARLRVAEKLPPAQSNRYKRKQK